MAKKRVSRSRKRDLSEPDEFISFWAKLFEFISEYKLIFSSALGVMVIISIIIIGMVYFIKKSEDKAFALLQQVIINYQTKLKTSTPEKAF
ncbi:MAG: hypothetical protein PVH36_08700, partial [Desulfobacterales bacterium]